jgi:branched-chain amino acid transport system permease protein
VGQSLAAANITELLGIREIVALVVALVALTLTSKKLEWPAEEELVWDQSTVLRPGPEPATSSRWRPTDFARTIGVGAALFALMLWWGTSSAGPISQGRLVGALPYAMGALSLYLITGLAGQISVAQTTMMGLGAVLAFNTAGAVRGSDPIMGQLPGFVVSVLGAGLLGMLVAIPALRVRGMHFAVVTLAFAATVDTVLFSEGTSVGLDPHQTYIARPTFIASDDQYVMWAGLVLAAMALLVTNLRRSRFGRGLMAVRYSEVAAAVAGINVAKYKIIAFFLSGLMAAVGGIFYAWSVGNARVTLGGGLNAGQGLLLFSFVVIAGMRRPSGAVLAGLLFIFMPAIVSEKFDADYVELVAGIGVVTLVLFLPDGLAVLPGRLVGLIGQRIRGRRGAASLPAAATPASD